MPNFKKNGGEAELKVYLETVQGIINYVTPFLSGQKYIFGNKMTIADFQLAAIMGSTVYN